MCLEDFTLRWELTWSRLMETCLPNSQFSHWTVPFCEFSFPHGQKAQPPSRFGTHSKVASMSLFTLTSRSPYRTHEISCDQFKHFDCCEQQATNKILNADTSPSVYIHFLYNKTNDWPAQHHNHRWIHSQSVRKERRVGTTFGNNIAHRARR
jgi:hypothetical protein